MPLTSPARPADRPSSAATSWTLALAVPVAAAGLSWLWAGAMISARACATGGSAGTGYAAGLAVLVLAGPAAALVSARRARLGLRAALAPAIISLMLAAPAVFVAVSWWWSNHNCMT